MPKRFLLFMLAFLVGTGCAGAGREAPPVRSVPARARDLRVTLLQTTDLHDHAKGSGHLGPGPAGQGGYARIAAYVEAVRAGAGHPVVLVDSGDWSMGTLYDLTLGRTPLPLWFADALRYDCITLGNHEFDRAPAGLAATLAAALTGFGFRTPIVASNLDLGGDTQLAPLVGPGKMIQATRVRDLPNGLRVGFLGLMGREAARESLSAPVAFTDYARDYGLVQDLVDDLRGRRGCALVVALDHAGTGDGGAGGEDVELARHVTGIDVIASGHTHNPLERVRTVPNGDWNTFICCAGASGTHVSRLDLAVRPQGGAVLEASGNLPMTDAALAKLGLPAPADPGFAGVVAMADQELNRALGPVLTRLPGFADYDPGDPARGIYHPLATCDQDLQPNGRSTMPAPSGLGSLCADALRAVPNALAGASGDATPFTAAALATGELRVGLEAGAPVTFADIHGLLPLGLSPDPDQQDITGMPLVWAYLDPEAARLLCALQLLAQTGLVGGDSYLNLSGLSYRLDPGPEAEFFAAAGAATALGRTLRRAEAGSVEATLALRALGSLPQDRGAALRALLAGGNPYAGALVRLGQRDPGPDRTAANLALLGQVAVAMVHDGATGSTELAALLLGRALAAVGPVSAFAPDDPACTGPAAPLGPGRIRVVLDLFLVTLADQAQAGFGARVALYQAATGDARLSAATPDGLQAVLANRIDANPRGSFRELKAWMAVLEYLATPRSRGGHFQDGRITGEYASAPDPGRFPDSGAAVRIRNAGYPLERLQALGALAAALDRYP